MQEFSLALLFAVLGFIFSSRQWLMFLNGLNPLTGLIVYYAILYSCLFGLSQLGLVIFGFRIKTPLQTFGLLLITFAFFIIVDWESAYVQYVTMGSVEGASSVYWQSEDGAVFYVWQKLLPFLSMEAYRFLTYVLTPFILALLGGLLISKKPKLG